MDDPAHAARACDYLSVVATMSVLNRRYSAQVDAHGNWIVCDVIQRTGYRIAYVGSYEECKAFAARGIAS
jgi:hypothetical protein